MPVDRHSLFRFLDEELGVDTTGLDERAPLFSSGLIDSVGLAQLIVYVEAEEAFSFAPEDVTLENLDSVERILAYVAARRGR